MWDILRVENLNGRRQTVSFCQVCMYAYYQYALPFKTMKQCKSPDLGQPQKPLYALLCTLELLERMARVIFY